MNLDDYESVAECIGNLILDIKHRDINYELLPVTGDPYSLILVYQPLNDEDESQPQSIRITPVASNPEYTFGDAPDDTVVRRVYHQNLPNLIRRLEIENPEEFKRLNQALFDTNE